MVVMAIAELSFSEKLALVPEAPEPVLSYSPKSTSAVLGELLDHSIQPAELMTEVMDVY